MEKHKSSLSKTKKDKGEIKHEKLKKFYFFLDFAFLKPMVNLVQCFLYPRLFYPYLSRKQAATEINALISPIVS